MDNIKFANVEVTNDCLIDAVIKVMRSGKFIQGQEVLDFERDWANLCNAKYCVSTSSGTMALFSMMRVLRIIDGVPEGERPLVVLPGLSYAATLYAVKEAGFDVIYCDVDKTGLIDIKLCEDIVKKHHDDIYLMPVHLYGQIVNLDYPFLKHVTIIEDAAQVHGVLNKVVGDAACFSFYPSKNLGGLGDGGAIVTNDEAIYTAARMYGNLGNTFAGKYDHIISGLNLRMDTIQAAFLQVKLELLNQELKSRKRQAKIYKEHGIETIATTQPNGYHLYPVFFVRPNIAIKIFKDQGIDVGRHYPYTLPQLEQVRDRLPNSMFIAGQNITLPMGSHLTEGQIEHVCLTMTGLFELQGKVWALKESVFDSQ